MWIDNGGEPHVSPSDAVTAAGLAHLDQCPTCRFLLNQCGPITVQVDPRPRVFAETYRWSLRCWAGFHRWFETNTDYERCTRCGKEERLY